MEKVPDLCLREKSAEVKEKAEEIGWADPDSYETVFLQAENWGELKNKIQQNREGCDVLVFQGGDEELNRKATEDGRIDILLHPEKGRRDSGMDKVVAQNAASHNVAIGFDFRRLQTDPKEQMHVLSHWRKNLRLCEKHDTPYLVTTTAEKPVQLRAPRDLKSVLDSLGYRGGAAVDVHRDILERNRKIHDSDLDYGGAEER
jgi:ribonuclease P/MRP protein subunit RPP1